MAIHRQSLYAFLAFALTVPASAALVNPCSPGSPVTSLQVCLTVDGTSTDFTPFVQQIGDDFFFDTSFLGGPFFEIPGELRIFSMSVVQTQPALIGQGTIYMLRPSIFLEDLGAPSTVSIFAARPLPTTDPFGLAFSEFNTSAAGTQTGASTLTPIGTNVMTAFGLPGDLHLGVDTGGACSAATGGFNSCPSSPLRSTFADAALDSFAIELSFSMTGNGASGGAFGMAGVQTPEPTTALLLAPALACLAYRRKRARLRVLSGGHGLPRGSQATSR